MEVRDAKLLPMASLRFTRANTWVFGGCDSVLYAVNLENGKLIRSVEVEAPIAASVSVGDGVEYVGNMDRAVMAFDLETGEVVWNYRNKSFPYFSSPALTEKQVLIGGRDKGLHCIKRSPANWNGGLPLAEE